MEKYTDIIFIKGPWSGGHNGAYPKILSVCPKSDKPFGVSEGCGYGLAGGYFTLQELIEEKFIEAFNREESISVYTKLLHAYQNNIDQKLIAKELQLNASLNQQ